MSAASADAASACLKSGYDGFVARRRAWWAQRRASLEDVGGTATGLDSSAALPDDDTKSMTVSASRAGLQERDAKTAVAGDSTESILDGGAGALEVKESDSQANLQLRHTHVQLYHALGLQEWNAQIAMAGASTEGILEGGAEALDVKESDEQADFELRRVHLRLYNALIIRVFVMDGYRILFRERCPRNTTVGDILIKMGKSPHLCVLRRNDTCLANRERMGDWGDRIVVFALVYRRTANGLPRGMVIQNTFSIVTELSGDNIGSSESA